ncbi:MAG TPA: cation-efflux pump [Solirubrobacteraceae bacterium]|jgi:cation diffusion facilitator family transporter|nr:cation-efflux pump [Solirubrobacteraceae bacterium]
MSGGGDAKHALTQRGTTLVSVAAASVLVALKLGVGLASGSLGLISAGIESSGDLLAAILTFFAVRLGGRPADRGHPYGHRRAENLGALGEAALLALGGLLVSVEAISHLAEGGKPPELQWYVFAVIGVALVVDLTRTSASLIGARRYASPALRSNAYHFAADGIGSLAVLAGLVAVKAGVEEADAVAALIIALITFLAAGRLIGENANVLMDRTPSEAREAAERAIAELGTEIELRRLRLRESAGRYFADVVVSVPAGRAVVEGHQAADLIEDAVEGALPGSDVVVHVEPRRSGLDLRDRVLAVALAEPLVREAHDIAIFEEDGSRSVSLHLKFPADLDLPTAHEVAERVEQAILARPDVADVQTHLEPLESALVVRPSPDGTEALAAAETERLVRERTGSSPRRVRVLGSDAGTILFLTLSVGAHESLADAHLLAGELEEELRQRIAGVADVIVHTEP